MMKKYLLFIFLWIGGFTVNAQSYRTAAGMRLGTDWGITIQQKIYKDITLEGIFQSSLKRDELGVTLLVEKHNRLISRRFNFYVGGGVHKSWVTDEDLEYGAPAGVTIILGAELTIARLNLSWDFKPAVNIWGGEQTFYSQTGISLRYVFIKKKKRDWKFWKKWGKKK